MQPVTGGPEEGLVSWVDEIPHPKERPTMPKQTLSERLLSQAGEPHPQEWCMVPVNREDLREAARLLAPFEQPEVAELQAKADDAEEEGAAYYAEDLRGYAHALVELAEAREKLGRVEKLLTLYGLQTGATLKMRELDAALAGAGEDSEVPSGNP